MKKLFLILSMLVCLVGQRVPTSAACRVFGFCQEGGKNYWYEDGKRQGVYGDPKNITDLIYGYERGREIFDPESNGWYWLDAVYDGAAAFNKEVWMPYLFQEDLKTGQNREGKWVRYDGKGKMIKGWYTVSSYEDQMLYPDQIGATYYYDNITGEMYKGVHEIEGVKYAFDAVNGRLLINASREYVCHEGYYGDWDSPYEPVLALLPTYEFELYENLFEGMGTYKGEYYETEYGITCYVQSVNFTGYKGDDVTRIEFTKLSNGSLMLMTELCGSTVGDIFE